MLFEHQKITENHMFAKLFSIVVQIQTMKFSLENDFVG